MEKFLAWQGKVLQLGRLNRIIWYLSIGANLASCILIAE